MPFCIGSKFAQNHSVSKGFWDNQHFWFPIKLKMEGKIWQFFQFYGITGPNPTVKKIEANLCYFIFGKSLKIQMAAIFEESKIFGKLPKIHCLDTLWVENFDEIALSRMVKEIEANLCFVIFGKNSKIQNGRHFGEGKFFLKIAKSTLFRYHVGRKFRRNHSTSHGQGDRSKFVFFHFWQSS